MEKFFQFLGTTFFVFALSACSGGGGGNTTSPQTTSDTTAPTFTSPATVSVNENNTSVLTLHATDNKSGVTYSISGGDSASFDLNHTSGVITFITAPDYETKNSYTFTAKATDESNNSVTQSVTVNILDVNETTLASYASFAVQAATYDDNATATTNDDTLYVYFSKSINQSSLPTDISSAFDINGTGAIGSASSWSYSDAAFHRLTIHLNNTGSQSTKFDTNATKIALAPNVLTDTNGSYTNDFNQTRVKKFNVFGRMATGQSVTYAEFDDGNTTRGRVHSYTDNGDGTVKDNVTGLMWQKTNNGTARTYADAITYCQDLILSNHDDWYLPSIEELVSIIEKGHYFPAINTTYFSGSTGSFYWSATTYASYADDAWGVVFNLGYDGWDGKAGSGYVRCVRASDN